MAFIVVFIIAMLIVPVMIDVERHGSDNILRRSIDDILHFDWVIAIGATAKQVALGSAFLVVFGYVLIKVAEYVISAIFRSGG